MTYCKAIEYLDSLNSLGSVPGLDNIRELLCRLGNPQNQLKIVHIAGTNGKGSVGVFLAYSLIEAGYKVGRYSSPAVKEYLETITIDNNNISENNFAASIEKIKVVCDEMLNEGLTHPTRFEIETAAAYLFFAEEKCDICIIECGMGGAEDATNVMDSVLCSVITSISLDHTGVLGSSIEEISRAKAGIIKNGCATICLKKEPQFTVISEFADQKNSELYAVDPHNIDIEDAAADGIILNYGAHNEIEIKLSGLYQPVNAAIALECIDYLNSHGYSINETQIKSGFIKTRWFGRFEVLSEDPYFIIDGAHNPDGARALYHTLVTYFPDEKIKFIMGCFADKDYDSILKILSPIAESFVTVATPNNVRALDSKTLAEYIKKYYDIPVVAYESIDAAISSVIKEIDKDDICVAFGSLSHLKLIADKYKECLPSMR